MPAIIGMDEAKKALKEITAKLKEVENINRFIETENRDGEYQISFSGQKVNIVCEDKENVNGLVRSYKERLSKQIEELASLNNIALTDEDKQVLGLN